jgi:hypothetical protein
MKLQELLRSILGKLKLVLGKLLAVPKKILLAILGGIKDILCHPLIVGSVALSLGFLVGARMHEVGFLAGMFGKSMKGATVFMSGPCKIEGAMGQSRVVALEEDEVKITSDSDPKKILGVIRKTRDLINCDTAEVSIDKLPLIANLRKSPVSAPELNTELKEPPKEPEWKKLAQKTLIMSGICVSAEGKTLPPFIDEKVEVTNVQIAKDKPEEFIITGIKTSDKIAIACENIAVKYSVFEPASPTAVAAAKLAEKEEAPKIHSFIGETILVTSTCFPDPRTPKHEQKRKVAFYPLINSKVQVTQEELDTNGKLKKIAGAALDFGDMIVCDGAKVPFTYKEFDPDSMKLTPIKANNRFEKDVNAPGSIVEEVAPQKAEQINGEAAAKEVNKAVSDGAGLNNQ